MQRRRKMHAAWVTAAAAAAGAGSGSSRDWQRQQQKQHRQQVLVAAVASTDSGSSRTASLHGALEGLHGKVDAPDVVLVHKDAQGNLLAAAGHKLVLLHGAAARGRTGRSKHVVLALLKAGRGKLYPSVSN